MLMVSSGSILMGEPGVKTSSSYTNAQDQYVSRHLPGSSHCTRSRFADLWKLDYAFDPCIEHRACGQETLTVLVLPTLRRGLQVFFDPPANLRPVDSDAEAEDSFDDLLARLEVSSEACQAEVVSEECLHAATIQYNVSQRTGVAIHSLVGSRCSSPN